MLKWFIIFSDSQIFKDKIFINFELEYFEKYCNIFLDFRRLDKMGIF